jgi:hypothetical protein
LQACEEMKPNIRNKTKKKELKENIRFVLPAD